MKHLNFHLCLSIKHKSSSSLLIKVLQNHYKAGSHWKPTLDAKYKWIDPEESNCVWDWCYLLLQAKLGLHIKLHSWLRCLWAAVQPARLSCGPQLFLENNNGKRKLGWIKKEKAFKDAGINIKTRQRQRHVHTYLICPNFSALWLDKSLHCAGYVVSHRYKQASDRCSQHH